MDANNCSGFFIKAYDCQECQVKVWRDCVYNGSSFSLLGSWGMGAVLSGSSLGLWIAFAVYSSQRRSGNVYRFIVNFLFILCMRRGLPCFLELLNCFNNDGILFACRYYALVDNFMGMYEIEMVTHVCIENFIYAWYTYKGRSIPGWHQRLFSSLIIMFATTYTFLPYLGVGSYCKDFFCEFCSIDSPLPSGHLAQIGAMMFYFLRSYKPAIIMIAALSTTFYLQRYKIQKPKDAPTLSTEQWIIFGIVPIYLLHLLPLYIITSKLMLWQYLGKEISPDDILFFLYGKNLDKLVPISVSLTYIILDPSLPDTMLKVILWRFEKNQDDKQA